MPPRVRKALDAVGLRLWHALPLGLRQPIYTLRYGAPPDRQWLREVMNRDLDEVLHGLGPQGLDVVEVSGDIRGDMAWRSYQALAYPAFDLCAPEELPGSYDLVICEQVLEHVPDPITAARTLRRLCRDDGHVLVSTPFLLRLHGAPEDFWRFTPKGMTRLLEAAGLRPLWVRSWGNRKAVAGNLGRWRSYRPWRSLANDPDLPMVVWAVATPIRDATEPRGAVSVPRCQD